MTGELGGASTVITARSIISTSNVMTYICLVQKKRRKITVVKGNKDFTAVTINSLLFLSFLES